MASATAEDDIELTALLLLPAVMSLYQQPKSKLDDYTNQLAQ
ncbi:hypothetical protein ACIQGZ_22325 [Streptomyces sp. NPDC092296]